MNVLDFVTVENIMPIKFCKDLITKTNTEEWVKHQWSENYNGEDNCDVLLNTELQNLLIPYVNKALKIYSTKFIEDNIGGIISKFSPPRLNRYQVGQGMKKHYDHIHSLFADNEGIPVLSLVGVFNDDYNGGSFVVRDKEITLKTGDILIMPSLFIYLHEVTKVTKGVRHSFVSWAY